ncbi:hypothetical protein PRIPAC_97967 [Pristionchus pacificus]|uniref:Uncharacterized protein n=1 Tax=Pristionchus pacificus TaxID=54126 RepID=A0A454Y7G4_PRIPA|nr:hypothetical protein PRIPAC_97967 [Pristionchus pacificus]|eukprot:PDM81767.1 hypothetical protein PRIPAC_37609 [Pristionchus pacificus]
MRSLIFLCFLGLAALAYAAEDPEHFPEELVEVGASEAAKKGPWTWEEIDGKKFKVYTHEDRIPHGFSKKIFIKKTRDHIIKYIRLKKCGCRVQTTRKTWVGPHKKLWYDDKHHHHCHKHGHHGAKPCNICSGHHGHHHGHHGHGHHGHGK